MDNKKEHFYIQHLQDLAMRAFHNDHPCFTDFLTSGELSLLCQNRRHFQQVRVETWGGHKDCDHKMGGFFPLDFEKGTEEFFPIRCIEVKAANGKYTKEITHRDYLGAILNLGIERSTIGDIRICEQTAYVFCNLELVPFIMNHLDQVKHTPVVCREIENILEIPDQQFEIRHQSVASPRLDNIVSAMIGSSRGRASELISQGKVLVDSQEQNANSFRCHDHAVLSIRGYGKYRLLFEEGDMTRKGKQKITIYQYK